jgi:hypothetical protein
MMRNKGLGKRGRSSLAALILLSVFIGCGKTADTPIAVKKTNLRGDFKDNFKSAFENMANETKSSSSQALSGALSKVAGLVGIPVGPGSLDPNFLNEIIEKIFESELAKAIFADENITSQTDLQIVYGLKPAICDKVAAMTAGESDLLIKACQKFLTDHAMEFRVGQLASSEMTLELWHAKGSADKKFVISLSASPNSVGARLNLGGAKELAESFLSLVQQDPLSNEPLISLKKLSGALNLQLRFKSDKGESGCKAGETLCFIANIDEDLDVDASMHEGKLALKFGKSPIDNPTILISAGTDGSFKGGFNLGALDFKLQMGQRISVFMESSQFSVTAPQTKDANAFEVMVENFKTGKNASFFDGFGKKVKLDLANESRTIGKIKLVLGKSLSLIDLSPFSFVVSLGDESNSQCTMFESIKLTTHKTDATQLTFTGMPGMEMDSLKGYSASCSEANLFVFPFWGMFKVASSHCDMPMSLAVKKGSLELNYSYHLNGGSDQTSTLMAEKDQCLRMGT